MSSFADARVMGSLIRLEKSDVRTSADIQVTLRDGMISTISVSLHSSTKINAQLGDTVLVWGELRDGNEICVTEFGEFRVLNKTTVAENSKPATVTTTEQIKEPIKELEILPIKIVDKPADSGTPHKTSTILENSKKVSFDDEFMSDDAVSNTPATQEFIIDEENNKIPEQQKRMVSNPRAPVDNPTGGPVLVKPLPKVPSFMKSTVSTPKFTTSPSVIAKPSETDITIKISEHKSTETDGIKGNFISSRRRFRTTPDEIDKRAFLSED